MEQRLLHTPEGVRDIYLSQCENKMYLESCFRKSFQSFGYQAIQTPTFEFFDIFSREIGTTPSKDLYKFFDREGNTLVLRPDITPSIARCAAKYFSEERSAVRLCYLGNTFVNYSGYQGRLKEVTQAGVELLGESSADADAEVIALSIRALLAAGLKDFQISIGHAGYLAGLMEASGLSEELAEEMTELMKNRNFWGVEELIRPLPIAGELKELFSALGKFYYSADELSVLLRPAKRYPRIASAVERLMELYGLLGVYEVENYVSFEPGVPEGRQYYTGVVFSGFSFGSGEPIVTGGRYDKLLSHFGKESGAIGFVIVVDQILMALERQHIDIPQPPQPMRVFYGPENRREAIQKAMRLRAQGNRVELLRKDGERR